MPDRTSSRAATPRTWFERRDPTPGRDPEAELVVSVLALAVLVAAPVVVVIGGIGYLIGRAARLRWWWVLAGAGALAVGVAVTTGWAGAAARYGTAYRELGAAISGPGGLSAVGALLTGRWAHLAALLLPGSLPLGVAVAAGGLGYTSLRRPAWRQPSGRVSERRRHAALAAVAAGRRIGDEGTFRLGVDPDTGGVVGITHDDLGAHALICGASGAGKSVLSEELARMAIAQGQGWVHVDLKGDPDVVQTLRAEAERWGRGFACFTIGGPARWNPLAHGDATERKDKLIGLERFTEPHYQRAAERFLQLVFRALDSRPESPPPTLSEVVGLLDAKQLATFARRLPEDAGKALLAYADSLTKDQASAVAGLATRLALLTESSAGPWLEPDPDQPDTMIDLRRVGPEGQVVVFSLDSGRYPGLAAQLGSLVIQDLKTAISAALTGPRDRWYVAIDEFSVVSDDHLLGLIARGRASGISCLLATQELADLDRAAPGFRDQVLGSTALKFGFRQDVPESAECWAAMAGTEPGWQETLQTAHRSASPLATAMGGATGVGTIRRVEQYRIHPNLIKTLPQGRCLLIRKHPHASAGLVDVARTTPTKG